MGGGVKMTLPEEKLPSKSPFLSGLNMFYCYVLKLRNPESPIHFETSKRPLIDWFGPEWIFSFRYLYFVACI